MPVPSTNSFPNPQPNPLSEEFIMDWVDGRIEDSKAAAIARDAGRAELIDEVAAMKSNRDIMASMTFMDSPQADPTQLLALLDAPRAAATRDAFPTFKFTPHTTQPSRATFVRPRLALWPLGMAAAVSLAAFIALSTSRQATSPKTTSTTTLAQANPTANEPAHSTEPVDVTPQDTRIAAADPAQDDLPSRLVIDADRAIELAREGRLLVRVAATQPELFITPLDTLVSGDINWRISDEVSRSMLAAVSPYFGADTGVMPASEVGPNEGRFLTAEMFGPPQVFATSHAAMASAITTTRSTTYLLHVSNESSALEGLKHTITSRFGANVLFEEMPRSMRSSSDNDPELSVPIIVEQR
jgi:hypothetical protein